MRCPLLSFTSTIGGVYIFRYNVLRILTIHDGDDSTMIELKKIDLNLLVMFHLMYQKRKTSLVAETLDLTQPAISNALAKLRLALNDELFVRTARGMRPTPYADHIAESVGYALSTLKDGLNHEWKFNPVLSDRCFSINMTDLGEMYLLPRLIAYLAKHAPSISVTTVRDKHYSLQDDLESGNVDLAVGLLPQLEAGFYQRHLFAQKYVCLLRKGHMFEHLELTLERFSEAKHMIIEVSDTGHGRVERLLAKTGITRINRLKIPHFTSAPYIVAETDMIATVPEKLALQTASKLGLVIKPHPVDIPPAQINMVWHRRFHQDLGNIWLRNLMFELFAE